MHIEVKSVKVLDNYILKIRFENNEEKIFDLEPYLGLGKFSELRDLDLFRRVRVVFDTIEWPNGVDFDPEFLYEHSVKEKSSSDKVGGIA
ncbi:DUF2442 domain-containing protein [Hippea alviniae]|uniref:DUF2442 domain-containing protein n=1 Tax=Hippea alviniae TaxID=1279027 RepID=UPI0003B717C6|nr:DUF2442 domain-containing protein [Hippea alviniae]